MGDPRRETEGEGSLPDEPRPAGTGEPEPALPSDNAKRDRVEKESKESFPASDAPSFTPGKLS